MLRTLRTERRAKPQAAAYLASLPSANCQVHNCVTAPLRTPIHNFLPSFRAPDSSKSIRACAHSLRLPSDPPRLRPWLQWRCPTWRPCFVSPRLPAALLWWSSCVLLALANSSERNACVNYDLKNAELVLLWCIPTGVVFPATLKKSCTPDYNIE